MDAVNRTGEVFLSHTRLDDRFTIRIAIGNLRTEPRHVERAWALLRREAARLDPEEMHRCPTRLRSCTSTARSGAPTTSSSPCSARTTGRSCARPWDAGRYEHVELFTPRFHGDGRADWDVLVSITYRDWAAIAEHSDPAIVERLYPDQATFSGGGAAAVRAARRALGRRAGARRPLVR